MDSTTKPATAVVARIPPSVVRKRLDLQEARILRSLLRLSERAVKMRREVDDQKWAMA